MPIDYSRFDAIEVSDDSDIEVHPNVDKRSFIRAKQNQIHQERQQRKNRITALKYERVINSALLGRVVSLLDNLKAHASEAATGNQAQIAFKAVLTSAGDPKDDQPPPRPEGVFSDDQPMPTYSKMLMQLLDQVNKTLDEKKVEDRYTGMLEEMQVHVDKIKELQKEQAAELEKLEKEEGKKITSDSIHDGFNSSYVNKSGPSEKKEDTKVELLNPNFSTSASASGPSSSDKVAVDDDDEIEASPAAKKFGAISVNDYSASLKFLAQNPEILTERETDGLLVLAFDAALERKDELSRQYVHQALLLQYCRALGKDGVALFFKRITTKGHQAQDVFYKDVQDTYMRIKNRSLEIIAERAKEPAEGVEQIQLHAMEPGTTIQIKVPPADSEDADIQAARKIYDSFDPEMKKALESGELDEVNKVLGNMKIDAAEELVGLFGEANILSLEEELIDATTEEGQKRLREMEAAAAAERKAEAEAEADTESVGDPE
ncbi:Hsp90 co-chaperone Cdc37 [Trichoderma asperellum]|uniref:Hsp90 chaperone protein kinase-targeting subunit n=1 Tax=Trichoderma asperellum TaxID=101201 RepID=A0A6V8QN36_TRIAP|nr:Hsp90 co-chaperone Cdc37 [Trichoderma asperellum]